MKLTTALSQWARGNDIDYEAEIYAMKRAQTQPADLWDARNWATPDVTWHVDRHTIDAELAVGDGLDSSAVVACLQVIAARMPEPPIRLYNIETLKTKPHPYVNMLRRPNPLINGKLMWHYVAYAIHTDGNAYFFKSRNQFGKVTQLWPILPGYMEPVGTDQSLIAAYRYTPEGHEIFYDPRDIVHLRLGIDPRNHRQGFSPLKAAMTEIYGDQLASQFANALTANTGVPAVLISPKDDDGPDEIEGERIVSRWNEKTAGDLRGSALFMNGPVDVTRLSFSPKDLDLTQLRRLPEERIAAVLGVPPILAGLGTGIENSSGRNETKELIEAFTEGKLVPIWGDIAEQLTQQLLWPDYRELLDNHEMLFDLSKVRALQKDENELYQRVSIAFQAGLLTRGEARTELGYEDTDSEDDGYIEDINPSNFDTRALSSDPDGALEDSQGRSIPEDGSET